MVGCASKSALFSRRFRDSFKLSVFMGGGSWAVVLKVSMDVWVVLDGFLGSDVGRVRGKCDGSVVFF